MNKLSIQTLPHYEVQFLFISYITQVLTSSFGHLND